MKQLQISVGIIRNPQGEIFITQRAADAHMANKLEFPGGKIEAGESAEQALVRELQEEVGITVSSSRLFDKLEYQFPDRHITLWFWLVEEWSGERDVALPGNRSRLLFLAPAIAIGQIARAGNTFFFCSPFT